MLIVSLLTRHPDLYIGTGLGFSEGVSMLSVTYPVSGLWLLLVTF